MNASTGSRRCIVGATWLVLLNGLYCLADEVRPLPAGATILSSRFLAQFVTQEPVREDLKLSSEQRERIDRWLQELEVATRSTPSPSVSDIQTRAAEETEKAQATLEEILTGDQVRRHRQLMLQNALWQYGLAGLVQLTEVKEILRLDAGQEVQIEGLRDRASQAFMDRIRSNRPQRPGMFANADTVDHSLNQQDLADEIEREISATLTADQKQALLGSFGPAIAGQFAPLFFSLPLPPPPPPQAGGIGLIPRPRLPLFLSRRPFRSLPASGLAGEELAESPLQLALVTLDVVRDELKVSSESVQQEVLLGGDDAEQTRCIRRLDQWLESVQLTRLRQLVLQVELERRGPAAPFAYREVVSALQLSDAQRIALEPIVNKELKSNQHALVLAIEPDAARRAAIEKALADRLQAVLTTPQNERLQELFGEPRRLPAVLNVVNRALKPRMSPRARTLTALGESKLENVLMLIQVPIQDELGLSDEQREAVSDVSELVRNRDKATDILSEKQRRRFDEILLQGEVRRDGPAALFRFRPVIDALAPTDDQRRDLLGIIQEDTQNYLRIAVEEFAEKLLDLDASTAAKLESVLTDDQREKLAGLLGNPAACLDEPSRPARIRRP
jgi:hypothetical protein